MRQARIRATVAPLILLLLGALAFGMLAIWMLHPTLPPAWELEDPVLGSWSWALHGVFEFGRNAAALAAAATALAGGIWWLAHQLSNRRSP